MRANIQTAVRREKTAIRRFGRSRPVALALAHEIIDARRSFFDYGCGRGEDVEHLRSIGIEASGWDPHYRPETPPAPADVVNLAYVLNVIEDPAERKMTLLKAYDLAQRVLVVAVRVDRALGNGIEFSDGLLTSRGSFQKIYQQSEFKDYLERSLARRPHMAALGVAYIFKDEVLESSYLASLANRHVEASRTYAIEQFSQNALAQSYVELARRLGRVPLTNEFAGYDELLERFGSPARIERLTQRLLSASSVEETHNQRREDILTYIALMRLQGLKPIPFGRLPIELRADIKMLWSSYAEALKQGEGYLFQIGQAQIVRKCCDDSPIGKKLPDSLYVHRSAEDQLGALLRILVFAARQIVGEVDYNVLKIAMDGRSISFLRYEDFESDAHPELRYSVRIYLPRTEYSIRDYSGTINPHILHRKETLVDPLHAHYRMFCELSAQEESLGLLSRPDIGRRQEWFSLLAEKGIRIEGHRIIPAAEADG